MTAEKAGVPAVVNTCEGFVPQAHQILGMGGLPWLPVVNYPGHIDLYPLEERNTYISELVAPGNENALTTQIEAAAAVAVAEAPETAIAFTGAFEEVLDYYREKLWSDGLPIIPPTTEKVEEFLKYTDYPADKVLGPAIQPSFRYATTWTVAVNGVMCGCRPEYMPILIAMAECMEDPGFGTFNLGSTPGVSLQTILNGPIVQQLDFNSETCVFKPGYQANSSVGRFVRLFLRNVPEIRSGITDMGTFGHNFRVVLPENDPWADMIGWQPFSVERGFKAGDNVVTIMGIDGVSMPGEVHARGPEDVEQDIFKTIGLYISRTAEPHRSFNNVVLVVIAPLVAKVIAEAGYSKADIKQRLFDEYARMTAVEFDWHITIRGNDPLCKQVAEGKIPNFYCESDDPNRMVPMVFEPEAIFILVAGDPNRNRILVISQGSGKHGFPTSKKIELPKNWDALLAEAKKT